MFDYEVKLKVFAIRYCLIFLVTMVLTGATTYTLTDYPDKKAKGEDKIYNFYNKFNPCIFFDHYPANVVGGVCWSILLEYSILMYVMVLIYFKKVNLKFDKFIWLAFISSINVLLSSNVINVFTANLYEEGKDNIKRHSLPYYLLLLGLGVYLLTLVRSFENTIPVKNRNAFYVLSGLLLFSSGFTTTTLLIGGYNEKNKALSINKTYNSISTFFDKTKMSIIGLVIPLFIWAWCIPEDKKFQIKQVESAENASVSVNSGKYMELSYRMMTLMFLFCDLIGFSDINTRSRHGNQTQDHSTPKYLKPLYKYYRHPNLAYIAAPVTILATFIKILSIIFSEINENPDVSWKRGSSMTSMIYTLTSLLSVLNVIPIFSGSRYSRLITVSEIISRAGFSYTRKNKTDPIFYVIYSLCIPGLLVKKTSKPSQYIMLAMSSFYTKFINTNETHLKFLKTS